MFKRLTLWAQRLKANLVLLWLCCHEPDMPWLPKAVALVTLAYALSPIDLIPDFIPVLGYLDDVLILPLGIVWALKLTPPALQARCRPKAQLMAGQRLQLRGQWLMVAGIIALWLGLIAGIWALSRAGNGH